MSARITVASLAADLATLKETVAAQTAQQAEIRESLAVILAAVKVDAPAKTVKAPARRAAKPAARRVAAATPKVTKGATALRTGAGMTKSDWNKTLATKARLAGTPSTGACGDAECCTPDVSIYSIVMSDWAEVQNLRAAGATPDEVLALYV